MLKGEAEAAAVAADSEDWDHSAAGSAAGSAADSAAGLPAHGSFLFPGRAADSPD